MFVFLRCFLLWLTRWLVASWRSNRVNYCWQRKLQSYLLAVDTFFSVRTLMNETHRIATKETLKNGHQKSCSVLIYLLLQCYSSVRKNLYSSLFLPLCLLFTRVTRSFLTAQVPFSISPYLESVSRRWLVRSSFTHQSCFPFTAGQDTVLLAPRWLHNGYKNS